VPDDVTFATRPAMACEMVARLLGEGTPCALVLADAVYGSDFRFRRMLEDRGQPHVLAVRPTRSLRFLEEWHLVRTDPATMIAEVPPGSWQSRSAGEGARGHRLYDWTRVPLNYMAWEGFSRWLLARRRLRDPKAVAYCFAYARTNTTLPELAAAGLRWKIKECCLRAKDDLGPDPCEMRSWHGWHRHMSLVTAAAFPVRLAADQRRAAFSKPNKTRPQTQMAAA
jgi:SRSO17 transposase